MKILFVASEATPLAKVGGIADVVGALPVALSRLGLDVRIVLPKYANLSGAGGMEPILHDVEVQGSTLERCNIYRGSLPSSNVAVYFIDNLRYLGQGPIYNEHAEGDPFSDISRFLFFSSAVASTIPLLGWKPDVIHCHDWHTSVLPALLRQTASNDIRTLLTIHNIAYQGVWNMQEALSFLGQDPSRPSVAFHPDKNGNFNALLEGVLAATMVNTVSPKYAKEIMTPEYGNGLEQVLKKRSDTLSGILNGIDVARFDPFVDRAIRVKYDASSIDRKAENKLALEELCGFPSDSRTPIFGFVGRLADQKGIELVLENSTLFTKAGARVVFLGTGIPAIEDRVRKAVARAPHNFFAHIGFDSTFAQQIYAGCDAVLVPSRFEPCGLVQMIAMRYGTIPVVRSTGGLKDTVPDVDADPRRGLGFTFDSFDPKSFWSTVQRAINAYQNAEQWRTIAVRCMMQDFSWNKSAADYASLYEQCLIKP